MITIILIFLWSFVGLVMVLHLSSHLRYAKLPVRVSMLIVSGPAVWLLMLFSCIPWRRLTR